MIKSLPTATPGNSTNIIYQQALSDLQLHLLGSGAGQHAARYAATALMTSLTAAILLVNAFLYVTLVGWPRESLAIYLGLCVVIVVCAAWRASRAAVNLQRLDINILSTRSGRRQLGRWLAAAFMGALMTGPVVGLIVGFKLGLSAAVTFGLLGGVGFGLTTRPSAIDRPSRLVQQGLVHASASVLTFGVAYALPGGLIFGLSGGRTFGLWGGLAVGFAVTVSLTLAVGLPFGLLAGTGFGLMVGSAGELSFGLTVGLAVGLAFGLALAADSPWPRYMFATILLAHRGDLPKRPAVFLDWAYKAGLIRLSGISVQFRHREFQSWLTSHEYRDECAQQVSDRQPISDHPE